jgi:arginase family enzyme
MNDQFILYGTVDIDGVDATFAHSQRTRPAGPIELSD